MLIALFFLITLIFRIVESSLMVRKQIAYLTDLHRLSIIVALA